MFASHHYQQRETMKKILYLLPILLGIIACGAQPQPTPNIADIVSATLTAIAQTNLQVIAPQPTFTSIPIMVEPIASQQAAPEANYSILSLDILQNATYRSPDSGRISIVKRRILPNPTNLAEIARRFTNSSAGYHLVRRHER